MVARAAFNIALVLLILAFIAGCARQRVIETQIVEKPVAVPCRIEVPAECKSAYAVDRISVNDDALTVNRAMRIELEERTACEIRLLAALKGCNTTQAAN